MSNEVLTLRELRREDLPQVLSWRNHPQVRRWMLTQHEISIEEHAQWFSKLQQDPQRHAVLVHEAEQALGLAHFIPVNSHGVVNWGFYLMPDAPKGSGSKLGRMALDFAFNKQGWHKVCGQVVASNEASRRFHLKLGFCLEGELRQHAFVGNEWLSMWCFGLLSSEWKSA